MALPTQARHAQSAEALGGHGIALTPEGGGQMEDATLLDDRP